MTRRHKILTKKTKKNSMRENLDLFGSVELLFDALWRKDDKYG